jgi:hypothetical protein
MNDMTSEELEKKLATLRAPKSPELDAGIQRMLHGAMRARARRLAPFCLAAAGILVGVGLVLLIQTAQRQLGLGRQVPIRISAIQGPVLVKHTGTATWEELSAGAALRVGDQLWSGSASSINLTLKDNSLVTLNASGVLSLKHHDGRVEFELTHGTMRAVLHEGHPPFVVRTPQGRLEALGTDFTVSVE